LTFNKNGGRRKERNEMAAEVFFLKRSRDAPKMEENETGL
jgi:hypothetical protein